MITDNHIALLAQLAGRRAPRSGEELASALGLTRARVSQLVRALKSTYGATFVETSRAGYASAWLTAMLDAKRCAVGTHWVVDVVSVTDSTNAALLATGARHAHALVAEHQTAGRGRRGRAWSAAPAGSVLLSAAWQFAGGAATLSGLSLCVGLAVTQALNTLGATDITLKWPNDIYWRGQKLGGVLIELSGDALGPTSAVIGIGLNVYLPIDARGTIDQPVTDLHRTAPHISWDRNAIINAMLAALEEHLTVFAQQGFAPCAPRWRTLHAFEGKPTRITRPDGTTLEADSTSIDDTGALVLKRGDTFTTVHSAEVTLRTKT